ncbi:MAG: shikimate kinase [Ignavibacteriae bacterium]|nr:shikimate kinase [Ignavibacteriota bacterium]
MEQSETRQRRRLIYLAGFMGSGKSTVGPILANTLGYEFIDIDKLIEEKSKLPVVQIFDSLGEKAFRSLEREALQEVSLLDGYVVSLGGGTIANEENLHLARESGVVVYLQLSQDEILQRMKNKRDRPMLKDAQGNALPQRELGERIEQLLKFRAQFYERADIIISSDKKKVGATVDEIVNKLKTIG